MPTKVERALARVRKACLALPDVEERPSHGAPTFFYKGKKSFLMFHDDHHGDGRLAIWCAAPLGVQDQVVREEPARFFVPAYVGYRGWIGVRLDGNPACCPGPRCVTIGWPGREVNPRSRSWLAPVMVLRI